MRSNGACVYGAVIRLFWEYFRQIIKTNFVNKTQNMVIIKKVPRMGTFFNIFYPQIFSSIFQIK
ncbi:hypothetical protein CDL62_17545 [Alkalitalea saponilacus]|nr:hypothetical protein CDL62_17545 [Alkalitalea saponilacus]